MIQKLGIVNKTPYEIKRQHGIADSCYDLFSNESLTIKPGKTSVVKTGIHFHIPSPQTIVDDTKYLRQQVYPICNTIGYEVQIRGRSGLSSKGILAAFGTIDSNYTGEVKVILTNTSDSDFVVEPGDRIAQFKMVAYLIDDYKLIDESELPITERSANGFGSTGVK